jgi:addiction module HigA family antidote
MPQAATVAKKRYPYEPNYIVTPGEVLQETVDALGMTQAELATRTGLSKKTVNQIIQGREPISSETAFRLERVTGAPARFWMNLETNYQEQREREAERTELASQSDWAETVPAWRAGEAGGHLERERPR